MLTSVNVLTPEKLSLSGIVHRRSCWAVICTPVLSIYVSLLKRSHSGSKGLSCLSRECWLYLRRNASTFTVVQRWLWNSPVVHHLSSAWWVKNTDRSSLWFDGRSFLGTPTEESWPGVTSLRYYTSDFPQWPPSTSLRPYAHLSNDRAEDLLAGCLSYRADRRLTAQQALEHSYFQPEKEQCSQPL